jgi:SAM-dependent MidA family methyltransferase
MNLADAERDSPALKQFVLDRIETQGPLRFDEYIALALYHPDYGYYRCCDPTLDYQSSPNVHPVFGTMIARQVADFWRLLGRPRRFDVFEAGAGSGRLAVDVLAALRRETPELYESVTYTLQDVAPREAEARRLLQGAGLPVTKVAYAAALPPEPAIEGCILSNELLDALPFRRVRQRDGALQELLVGASDGRFVDVEVEAPPELINYFEALSLTPGEDCEAEVNLAARDWMTSAATALRRGYVLTLDYGYEAAELYAPWRKRGTLLTFYRHTADDNPYARLGRQDITASIDLTAVRWKGEAAGLRTYGSVTQAEFLSALGIADGLRPPPAADQIEAFYALRRAAIELTDGAGLGRIQALVQGKDTPDTLPLGLRGALTPPEGAT